MGREDYSKAYKLGKKDYQSRMLRGKKPTLQVLDDIMPEKGSYSEYPEKSVYVWTDAAFNGVCWKSWICGSLHSRCSSNTERNN